MYLHVFYFVESAEQPHLDGSVLLGIGEAPSVGFGPSGNNLVREKDTNGIGQFTVGGDVEDVLVGVRWMRVGSRGGAFADEVVLVNIALRSGVGLQAADGHGAVVGRSSLAVRKEGVRATSGPSAGVNIKDTEIGG